MNKVFRFLGIIVAIVVGFYLLSLALSILEALLRVIFFLFKAILPIAVVVGIIYFLAGLFRSK